MKTATKVLGGVAVAVALGVATKMFLSSKRGKALTKNIKETVVDFYEHVTPQLKKIGKMGEKDYKEFMKGAVEKYSEAKKLSRDTAKELAAQVQKSWKHFSENLE